MVDLNSVKTVYSYIPPLLRNFFSARKLNSGFSEKKNFPQNSNLSFRMMAITLLMVIFAFVSSRTEAAYISDSKNGFEKALYINPYYKYAIELSVTNADIQISDIPNDKLFNRYIYYKVKSSKDGINSYRLRLGFFIYHKSAQKLANMISKQFKGATVIKVSKKERNEAVINFLRLSYNGNVKSDADSAAVSGSYVPTIALEATVDAHTPEILSDSEMNKLMEKAKKALTSGDNKKAVGILKIILSYPSNIYTQPALEYLGLAEERLGQYGLARAEYEKYLGLYKSGKEHDRVRQRLNSLLTARELPKKKLLENVKNTASPRKWEKKHSIDWSQYYNLRSYKTGDEGYQTRQSNLYSDLYMNSTANNSRYDIRFIFSGGFENDFIDTEDSTSRIDSLYLDAMAKKRNISIRLGRQSATGESNGISGRFDGIRMTLQKSKTAAFKAYAGYPVEYPITNDIKKENPFVSLAIDLGTYKDAWDISGYILNQQIDNITDRRTMGGEVHFSNSFSSIYTLFDYDESFNTINNVFVSGTWFNKRNASLHLSFDFRKSPFISTSNSLFNEQEIESVSELLETMTLGEIREKARENTGFIQSFSGGGSYPLSGRLHFYGEINLTKSNYTPSGYDIFSSGQLALTDFIKTGNYTTMDSRYYSNSGSDTYTAALRSRYPFTRRLKVTPRIQFDYKIKKRSKGKRYTTTPSLKTEYRWKRRFYFELEIGGEWSKDTPSTDSDTAGSFFVLSGYRITL